MSQLPPTRVQVWTPSELLSLSHWVLFMHWKLVTQDPIIKMAKVLPLTLVSAPRHRYILHASIELKRQKNPSFFFPYAYPTARRFQGRKSYSNQGRLIIFLIITYYSKRRLKTLLPFYNTNTKKPHLEVGKSFAVIENQH